LEQAESSIKLNNPKGIIRPHEFFSFSRKKERETDHSKFRIIAEEGTMGGEEQKLKKKE